MANSTPLTPQSPLYASGHQRPVYYQQQPEGSQDRPASAGRHRPASYYAPLSSTHNTTYGTAQQTTVTKTVTVVMTQPIPTVPASRPTGNNVPVGHDHRRRV